MTNVTICNGPIGSIIKDLPAGCHPMGKTTDGNYYGYNYLNKSGVFSYGLYNNGQLMLADGTLIFFDDCPADEKPIYSSHLSNWKGCMIAIDINGSEKPDRLGYDFFLFESIDAKLYPMGDPHTTYANNDDCDFDKTNQTGTICAQKALSNSDYFKELVRKIKN